jgi:hypothetical protein
MKLAIILAEFGRPAPDVTQFRETWPEAEIQVFGDSDVPKAPQFAGSRFGWRMNDYWKVRKLLDSGADIAISFDSDMRIVNRLDARTLPLLAERFGLCLPLNPRYLVRVDTQIGADSDGVLDETRGCGLAMNCTPIALNLHHPQAVEVAEWYCHLMLSSPVRGPVNWWRAVWHSHWSPCILPPQWCVCIEHIGCKDPIILHEGHGPVRTFYETMRSI